MSRRPTAIELLEAAREHITQVAGTLHDPRLKFQTLVAAHVLGVVMREIMDEGIEPEGNPRRMAPITALMGHPSTDADLCAAIREGAFDSGPATQALIMALITRVEADVALWNPGFLPRVRGD